MIISDLRTIEDSVLAKSSNKEKLFNAYLNNEDTSKITLSDSPTDLLCIDAFIYRENKSGSLTQLQRTKPLKNIHYSQNLIDLIAAYILDPNDESQHLNEYSSSHNLREAYIISLALNVDINKSARVESNLDRLIKSLVIDKNIDSAQKLFTSSLMDISHIFDVIVIKNLYSLYLMIHPDSEKISDYESVHNTAYNVSYVLDKLIILILSTPIAYYLIQFILWSFENKKSHVEIWGWVQLLSTIILAILIFLGINLPSKNDIFSRIRRSILRGIYKLIGLNYDEVKSILNKGKL